MESENRLSSLQSSIYIREKWDVKLSSQIWEEVAGGARTVEVKRLDFWLESQPEANSSWAGKNAIKNQEDDCGDDSDHKHKNT